MTRGRDALLEVRGLCKRFGGTEALRDVDFSVLPGEIHALARRERRRQVDADQDTRRRLPGGRREIRIGGVPRDQLSVRRRIAFVHQDLGLIETMSVGENMAMGYGYPRRLEVHRLEGGEPCRRRRRSISLARRCRSTGRSAN